jgi:hypothetical protein
MAGMGPFAREQIQKWSSARLNAWALRHSNPNAYYYRFTGMCSDGSKPQCSQILATDPNVPQGMGDFSREEHAQFMKRVEEFRANSWHIGNCWGLFSLTLPRRVGYQCSNYYRKLLLEGVLSDPTYVIEGGKLKQLAGDRMDPDETCVAKVCCGFCAGHRDCFFTNQP